MKCAVDLHMHSCLSPCGDDDMTPNNMANMAMIKGLDIVALTDHNCHKNSHAFNTICRQNGLLAVCGMEVTSMEEIHVVTLFPNYEALEKAGKIVYSSLMDVKNAPDIFGNQLVLNERDEPVQVVSKLLINATELTVDDIFLLCEELGGVAIPAHIDRDSHSMYTNFGMIPKELSITTLELSKHAQVDEFLKQHQELSDYRFIRSSDAHNLFDIFEREDNIIELEERTVECLFDYLKSGKS